MTTLQTLEQIFKNIFSKPELVISEQTSNKDISEWDSLNQIKLIMTVEEKFGIKLTMSEMMELNSVSDFIKVIESHQK